ncbi:MAG: patatin-like phospholipase family protein [Gemmatimonadales bacterium]|nr:patatin-like phospholipase family protein [Gemmatimonadales bacterium]
MPETTPRAHRPFSLVLGGGGARGFAHLGVLRALEQDGYRPRLVVGVSMGALVGVAYAKREDWYQAVLEMRLGDFPGPDATPNTQGRRLTRALSRMLANLRVLWDTITDWGPAARARSAGLKELRRIVGHEGLNASRLPVVVTATDLRSGERVVLRSAPSDDAVYASAALAGALPPLELGESLLADGAYTDLAPVDLARGSESAVVIAVDAGQLAPAGEIRNGYQALFRAMEICHRQHAKARFAAADLVLRPNFTRSIGTLEFSARRDCVAAGIRVVRAERERLEALLGP